MEYAFSAIESKWKKYWQDNNIYKVTNNTSKPKYYILDMFPYPSGAGLHVGHPLGYIASDIFARYKRQCGYNVLHPMGFDAFGLPAEQYALETGQHPAVTTEKNIARYKEQLDNIGFCYDWSREVRTSEPSYYKWTQWIFLQLFNSWYDRSAQKAKSITELMSIFKSEGNKNHPCPEDENLYFDAAAWNAMDEEAQRNILMQYRLGFLSYANVWWCEALGTVLANDEVVNGVSERGGHPVEKKKMRQWFLRITEYADRLLSSLDKLDWSEAMKEMQRNWIGKSMGAEIEFSILNSQFTIPVFTTRPDTIFGVDFMVLAPEHELVDSITTTEQQQAVADYKKYVQSRSERERMTEVKQITGCFTGAYAVHPFTGKNIPVWISEYVLAGYGTGAIMAVPSGDNRDHAFAKHFQIPITNIFGDLYNGEEAYADKNGTLENSDFLNGKTIQEATKLVLAELEKLQVGKSKVNFKMRDAGFSRQRYWGEPFPIIYKNGIAYGVDELNEGKPVDELLPVLLPQVDHYQPGPEGQGPLANITEWMNTPQGVRESSTMPGYAGSSWYFLRYMDPHNTASFASKAATNYWQAVDLYVGGTEHAVGHLLYSRLWTKVLFDLGHINFEEPFKKLLNQGMIQGMSAFVQGVWVQFGYYNNISDLETDNNQIAQDVPRPIFLISDKSYDNVLANGIDEEIDNWVKKMYPNINPIEYYSKSKQSGFSYELRAGRQPVDISLLRGNTDELDIDRFKEWRDDYKYSDIFLTGEYLTKREVEKMSKSKHNVINPDNVVAQYGADTFRMYEMFLGPIDVSKPWDTKGIEGVHRFIKKLWRLFYDEQKGWQVNQETAAEASLKTIHKTIKKIAEDIEKFSFNTSVSQFMICVNELTTQNCHAQEVLEKLVVIINPFAPHLAEELWHQLGHETSVADAAFPAYEEKYVVENTKLYPVAVNGKTRLEMEFPLDAEQSFVEQQVLANENFQKYLEGKTPKKIIFVKGRMINVVI